MNGMDYTPTLEGIQLISERIIERLSKMKHIHYYGKKITSDVAIDMIISYRKSIVLLSANEINNNSYGK